MATMINFCGKPPSKPSTHDTETPIAEFSVSTEQFRGGSGGLAGTRVISQGVVWIPTLFLALHRKMPNSFKSFGVIDSLEVVPSVWTCLSLILSSMLYLLSFDHENVRSIYGKDSTLQRMVEDLPISVPCVLFCHPDEHSGGSIRMESFWQFIRDNIGYKISISYSLIILNIKVLIYCKRGEKLTLNYNTVS